MPNAPTLQMTLGELRAPRSIRVSIGHPRVAFGSVLLG